MESNPRFLAIFEAVGRILGAGWIDCISRSFLTILGAFLWIFTKKPLRHHCGRGWQTTDEKHRGFWTESPIASVKESPVGANIQKTQQIITTCWGSFN